MERKLYVTGDLKAAMKPALSRLQRELELCMELPNKMNSQPLRGTQKKKKKCKGKEARGRRREGDKLNPVKLFFHSQWAWQRTLTHAQDVR